MQLKWVPQIKTYVRQKQNWIPKLFPHSSPEEQTPQQTINMMWLFCENEACSNRDSVFLWRFFVIS